MEKGPKKVGMRRRGFAPKGFREVIIPRLATLRSLGAAFQELFAAMRSRAGSRSS